MTVALRGERVTLRPTTPGDAGAFVRWAADPSFAWHQWGRDPGRWPDEDAARAWIARLEGDPAKAAAFTIDHDGRPIGFANYRDLEPKARSAEIGIGIGEPGLWGKHLGREALELLVGHLERDLGLHRISLRVIATNDRAIWAYKRCGFLVEGVERDAVLTDRGTYLDDVVMARVAGRPSPAFRPWPVTLDGEVVRLLPLRMEHAAALHAAGDEDEIWAHVQPRPRGVEGYAAYIRRALDEQILGNHLPFAVERRADGRIVGTTRFAHIDPANRTTEIGWTFYGSGARRTAVNTESKLLLFGHAFDTLGANRVWLQTDKRNQRSQDAMARLGALKDAELRDERILADGTLRTSVIYAVIRPDWPAVGDRLRGSLARHAEVVS
ncbi:MAG TPA: GNAT family N-acetyltransferase [Candidatus Limnocylindria bacterium]